MFDMGLAYALVFTPSSLWEDQMLEFIICLAVACAPFGLIAFVLGYLYPEEW